MRTPRTPRGMMNPFVGSGGRVRAAYNVGRGLYAAYQGYQRNRRRPTPVVTPRGTVHVRRKKGAAMSKSKGFFKKPKRKVWKRKATKMKLQGVDITSELGGLIDAKKVAYIVHAACPLYLVRVQLWKAVFKKFFEKVFLRRIAGVDEFLFSTIYNPALPPPITQNYVSFRYRTTAEAALSTYNFWGDQIGVSQAWTLQSLSNFFAAPEREWNNPNTLLGLGTAQSILFIDLRFFVSTDDVVSREQNYASIDFQEMGCEFYSKSTLKLQNRSINSAGNTEADEVDNVPLHGYQYMGIGNGPVHKNRVNTNNRGFIVDNEHGVKQISINGSGPNFLQEPPLGADFQYVQKTNKVRLDPGEIKTSVLISRKKMSFQSLYRQLIQIGDLNQLGQADITGFTRNRFGLGNFRMFALEKMLDVFQNDEQPSILVGYEHNIRMIVQVTLKRTMVTLQEYKAKSDT